MGEVGVVIGWVAEVGVVHGVVGWVGEVVGVGVVGGGGDWMGEVAVVDGVVDWMDEVVGVDDWMGEVGVLPPLSVSILCVFVHSVVSFLPHIYTPLLSRSSKTGVAVGEGVSQTPRQPGSPEL